MFKRGKFRDLLPLRTGLPRILILRQMCGKSLQKLKKTRNKEKIELNLKKKIRKIRIKLKK